MVHQSGGAPLVQGGYNDGGAQSSVRLYQTLDRVEVQLKPSSSIIKKKVFLVHSRGWRPAFPQERAFVPPPE